MTLQNYDVTRHDRFYNGADKNFVGDPYDWSGVGLTTTGGSGIPFLRWGNLIGDCIFISSAHNRAEVGQTLRFYHDNDAGGSFDDRVVTQNVQVGGTDLVIGFLDNAVSANVVTPFSLIDRNWLWEGDELYTYGRNDTISGLGASQRLGRNIIDALGENVTAVGASGNIIQMDYNNLGLGDDESLLEGGDSGGGSYKIFSGVPTLAGVHWFRGTSDDNLDTSGDTLVSDYIDDIIGIVDDFNLANGTNKSINVVPEPSISVFLLLSLCSFFYRSRV